MPSAILHRALLATTAICGLAAASGAAHAQTNTQINTSGASSVIYGGGSSLAFPSYVNLFAIYSGGDPTTGWNWSSKGSGNSQCAFIVDKVNPPPLTGEQSFYTAAPAGQSVDLAASDGFLSSQQIYIYDHGFDNTSSSGSTSTCAFTSQDLSTTTNVSYPTPAQAPALISGPIIQVPTFGTPVTLAYNVDGTSGKTKAVLTDDMLCGIFSGAITTFNNPRLASSGLPSSSATIHPTYRSDGSGTSFLFTNHLKSVCTPSNSTASFAANLTAKAPTTTFSVLFTNGGGAVPSNFVGAAGSSGVTIALGYKADGSAPPVGGIDGIGYLSPDFTQVAPKNKFLQFPAVASVVNGNDGITYAPTAANTATALSTAVAPTTAAQLTNPQSYVPAIPSPPHGYPIAGYTTFDFTQCYADANLALGLNAFLGSLYSAYTSTLTQNGFVQLTSNFVTAISNNLLSDSGLHIDLENPGVCNPSINLTLAGFTPGGGTLPGR